MSTDKTHRWAQMKAITAITLLHIFALTLCLAEERPLNPQRIISLGPAITEQLYLLGAEDKLVGVTTYCTRPAEAQHKVKVGTVLEADLEKIVSLRPDLVLATPLANPQDTQKLKDLGIPVVVFPLAKNFSQICAQFLELARLVDKEKPAREITQRATSEVERLKQEVCGRPKQSVFVQIGARPLFAANEDYFIHEFIEAAGGINMAAGLGSGLCSREMVIQQNPEVIIVAAMGMVGEQERQVWQRYPTLKALRNKRIYIVDPDKFCRPTPPSFVAALKEMIAILHPQTSTQTDE